MIRPEKIQEYTRALASGQQVDRRQYEADLRSEVQAIVRQQAQVGIDVISDGEYGKPAWTNYASARVTGFEFREGSPGQLDFRGYDRERFSGFYQPAPRSGQSGSAARRVAVCVGPITYSLEGRALMQRDIDNFKLALAGLDTPVQDAFLPVVAPCSVFMTYRNEYYKSEEDFLFAVAEALHEEYQLIVDAGLLVQADDAMLANMHDAVVDSGRDYRKWVEMNIEALNHALRGIPEDRVRYHLCWGSWAGPHANDVPLAEFVDILLKANVQAFSIEAANPRHEWEWVVWQETKLPEGKVLLPGVISHATSHIEHPELVAQRIALYARLVGPENVIASTDCGFAQVANQQRQHPEIVWAKLDALVEGARIASSRKVAVPI
jgi:5-methyltetrahydropteroyltriglutamate--homocysteine methyltransferase